MGQQSERVATKPAEKKNDSVARKTRRPDGYRYQPPEEATPPPRGPRDRHLGDDDYFR